MRVFQTLEQARAETSWLDNGEEMIYIKEEEQVFSWIYKNRRSQLICPVYAPRNQHETQLRLLVDEIPELIKKASKKRSKKKDVNSLMIQEMYDRLDEESKREMKEKYKNESFFKDRCVCCNKHSVKKEKCLKSDCCGMCAECYRNSIGSGEVEKCPACGEKQVVECPICTEEKKIGELLQGKKCSHCVCLTCFAESYRSGYPIDTCPMCRADFH